MKTSRLQGQISALKKITEPLKPWRDKRYAHFENVEVRGVTCNLQDLFLALDNLCGSLSFISDILLNPSYIPGDSGASHIMFKEPSCYLEESYFKRDITLQECIAMLRELNLSSVNSEVEAAAPQ